MTIDHVAPTTDRTTDHSPDVDLTERTGLDVVADTGDRAESVDDGVAGAGADAADEPSSSPAADEGAVRTAVTDDAVERETGVDVVGGTPTADPGAGESASTITVGDTDVSDLTAAGVDAYARSSRPDTVALERRGPRTILRVEDRPAARARTAR